MFFSSKMVFKQQNRLIPIPQPSYLKLLVFTAIFLFLLFIGGQVFGASPFSDNFDAYSPGDLVPQGNWATTTPVLSPQVSTSTFSSSPNSVWWTSGNYGSIKEGSHKATGQWNFWAKVNSDTGTNAEITAVSLTGFDYSNTASLLQFSCVGNDCEGTELVKIEVCIGGGAGLVEIGQIPINMWTNFQVQWASSTNETRWKFNSSSWSDWGQCYTNTFDYVQGFYIQGAGQTGKLQTNLDSISAGCSFADCRLCEIEDTCVDAGCSWYYSIFLQGSYCIDPTFPDPEECGSFFKCQYCSDQTTCEAELNCDWKDIGLGDKCYMSEPTIPPGQVDWEVPDIDECSGLPALDTIVCELKNLISGAVMPSQAKIETLYQTFGAFQEKFPFNYAKSLNTFFTDISESFDETTTIPIEILGATSSVSFTFWNATTTIGGEEETLKNVLFDFTTALVVIGWFAWLISLIKRFF